MKPKHLVIDAGAFVKMLPLWEYGEELYSVTNVISEIRDRIARERFESLPVPVKLKEPQPWAIKFIHEFSKKTGDAASLSLADVKLLALTYELEIEARGTSDHLRKEPVKPEVKGPTKSKTKDSEETNPEGFHLPKEELAEESTDNSSDINKSLSNCTKNEFTHNYPSNHSPSPLAISPSDKNDHVTSHNETPNIYWRHMLGMEDYLSNHSYIGDLRPTFDDLNLHRALLREYPQFNPLPEDIFPSILSALGGSPPTNNRPLHSTFPCIKRWAFHMTSFSSEEKQSFPFSDRAIEELLEDFGIRANLMDMGSSSNPVDLIGKQDPLSSEDLLQYMNSMSLNGDENTELNNCEEQCDADFQENGHSFEEDNDHIDSIDEGIDCELEKEHNCNEDGSYPEVSGEEEIKSEDMNEEEEDDEDDDEGWITPSNLKQRKLKKRGNRVFEEEEEEEEALVACITSDFAVQNILKHVGLSVMGVDGKIIRQIKSYILRCHACFKTTSDMSKIFCPKCGNKTLKRVSVTINPDGTQKIWINFKRPINTKGMIYTLPKPKGGQHARNPILVADQKEARLLSSKKSMNKINPLHEDYNPGQSPFAQRDVYSRAAQLGYIGGKCHNHFYWESKNPNAAMRKQKHKKK